VVLIPAVFTVWSLVLFWLERHRVNSNYLVIGLVIFLGGYIINGALRPIFPVISVTTAISVAVLGYGVAQQQLFNPLKELTDELQEKIKEREQAEHILREERRILRTLIDNLPDYIFVKDAESRFILNNAAHLQGMGVSTQEEVLGKTDLDIFPQEFAAQYYADEQQIIQSGEPLLDREEPVLNKTTGEERWVAVTKVPLQDDEGNVTGLVGVSRDITERKRTEAERERLQQQIIEAQQQTLQELSTPIIPVMDNIIIMPLVGMVDSMRAKDITRSLLAGITQHKAKVVIIDITGVSMIDTDVVSHLNRTIQAAKLKGAQTIVTGISDIVAETIVDLGLDWHGITTLSNLQRGLVAALRSLGVEMSRSK
jgi:PAS domain S-box-containing protein